MKTLYVHSGLPKNASSALQVFFAKHQKQLYDKGVDYFDLGDIKAARDGNIASGNGSFIARSMLPKTHEAYYDSKQNLRKSLLKSIRNSQCKVGLLSSEYFAVVPGKILDIWKQSLAKEGVAMIVTFYVRRQDQVLMSSYMQRVKRHGYTGLPENYILSAYDKPMHLKYFGFTNDLVNHLGREHVLPFIYEATKTHSNGIIGHFLKSVLGIVPDWDIEIPVVNTSPSPLEIKFLLMANQYSPRMVFSDFIVKDSINRKRSQHYKQHKIVSIDTVQKINSYFKGQNQRFEEKFGNGDVFPEINTQNHTDHVDLETVMFSSDEMVDVISGLLVRFDRRISRLENK